MKRVLMSLMIAGLGVTLSAQPGVFAVKEAGNADGKMLTMEETILGALSPRNRALQWRPESSVLTYVSEKTLVASQPAMGVELTLLTLDELNALLGTQFQRFPNYSWVDADHIAVIADKTYHKIQVQDKQLVYAFAMPTGAENFTPAPQGDVFAFTRRNNLLYCDKNGNVFPITREDNPNIIYGQSVSRNEFGIAGGIFWSPDGTKVAYYRKDETSVGTFPLLDINTRTGSLKNIKYPMAGMPSENVQLVVYDLALETHKTLKVTDFGREQYLTNITWSPDSKSVFIQVLNRDQKEMHLNQYAAATGKQIRTILTESNEQYVEPQDPIVFLKNNPQQFIYRTDNRDGYRNLYLCDLDGKVERLTQVDADVAYVGQDAKAVYYTSAEISPVENHLFRQEFRSGRKSRLTPEQGWHQVRMSSDCKYFLDNYSSLNVPRVIDLRSTDGKFETNLLTASDPMADYAMCEIDLGTVKSADGAYDNYYRLIKPKDFDPEKKYPVIVYVYGGPHSQMVKNTWCAELRRWEMYMAQRGYLVYVQDNRGTSNRGAAFEKAIHGQCGQAEMADQMEGIKLLQSLPYVDAERIGVHGWSYGGFMTISLITNYPDVFKVAVAGGPVIDWKWYEVMYGERYMDSPHRNAAGYEKVSLLNKAKDLKGKLLICQGAVDNVVLWEHSLSFIRQCIIHNVQVDYFPYPCAEHNVLGKDRIHLMDKVSLYFDDYL